MTDVLHGLRNGSQKLGFSRIGDNLGLNNELCQFVVKTCSSHIMGQWVHPLKNILTEVLVFDNIR